MSPRCPSTGLGGRGGCRTPSSTVPARTKALGTPTFLGASQVTGRVCGSHADHPAVITGFQGAPHPGKPVPPPQGLPALCGAHRGQPTMGGEG